MNKVEFNEAIATNSFWVSGWIKCWGKYPLDVRMNLEICVKMLTMFAILHEKQDKYFREENKLDS